MPAGAKLVDGLADPVTATYVEAERIMYERLARRLARGLSSPSWVAEKLFEVQAMRAELQGQLEALQREGGAESRAAILKAYGLGRRSAASDLAAGGVTALAATDSYRIGLIVADAMRLLGATQLRVLRFAEDAYRSVIATSAAQVAAGTITRRDAVQDALWSFADQGITGFIDSAGRGWDLASYAEMAIRTSVGHAAIQGHLDTLRANGHDLVIVSNVGGECELCRPWEGRTLSASGTSRDYPPLDRATSEGLFHPGCRHNVGAFFPGLTPPYGDTSDPNGAADRERLRYLERQTRAAKLRAATAVDDAARREAQARVRSYQAKIRDHVDSTGLLRQRQREQVSRAPSLRNT